MRKPVTPVAQPIQLNYILEPDVLTVFEFSRVHRQKAHSEPEKRLMFAVLTDAIDCYQKYWGAKTKKHLALSSTAEAWILSNNDSPFSFETICQTLDIDPVYLRLGLLQWRAKRQPDSRERKRVRTSAISLRVKNNQISA